MAQAFVWVTVCIICASTAVKAADAQADNPNFDIEKFANDAADKFTKRAEEVFKAAEAKKAQEEIAKRNLSGCVRPASGAILNAQDFKNAVGCALSVTLPAHQGKTGLIIVSFVVLEDGVLEDLKVEQSSGDFATDEAALSAVRQADIPNPPSGLSEADRTFRIQYISK